MVAAGSPLAHLKRALAFQFEGDRRDVNAPVGRPGQGEPQAYEQLPFAGYRVIMPAGAALVFPSPAELHVSEPETRLVELIGRARKQVAVRLSNSLKDNDETAILNTTVRELEAFGFPPELPLMVQQEAASTRILSIRQDVIISLIGTPSQMTDVIRAMNDVIQPLRHGAVHHWSQVVAEELRKG